METPSPFTQPPPTVSSESLRNGTSFCVILKEAGQTGRLLDRSPDIYIREVSGAQVAWIDFTTTNLENEIESLGSAMGFQKIPYQKLLSGFYSSYEDYDEELGIMLPAVSMTESDLVVRPIIILLRDNMLVTLHNGDINRLLKFPGTPSSS